MHPIYLILLFLSLVAGCSSEIYVRDGVTDGDTFYLPNHALTDDDPVLQSWVRYSLALSTCKLMIGGDNPARASSYDCELTARRHLVDAWVELRGDAVDHYLDTLANVRDDGWLPEYVAANLGRDEWVLPPDLDLDGYRHSADVPAARHRAETRIIGSWNYARNVNSAW